MCFYIKNILRQSVQETEVLIEDVDKESLEGLDILQDKKSSDELSQGVNRPSPMVKELTDVVDTLLTDGMDVPAKGEQNMKPKSGVSYHPRHDDDNVQRKHFMRDIPHWQKYFDITDDKTYEHGDDERQEKGDRHHIVLPKMLTTVSGDETQKDETVLGYESLPKDTSRKRQADVIKSSPRNKRSCPESPPGVSEIQWHAQHIESVGARFSNPANLPMYFSAIFDNDLTQR